MGNCCGKPSSDDSIAPRPIASNPFNGPGHRLGGGPTATTAAKAPLKVSSEPSARSAPPIIASQPKPAPSSTLHQAPNTSNIDSRPSAPPLTSALQTSNPRTLSSSASLSSSDPRTAAARTAEERLSQSGKPVGKLGRQLAKQKAQTRSELLSESSREEVRHRELEAMKQARACN